MSLACYEINPALPGFHSVHRQCSRKLYSQLLTVIAARACFSSDVAQMTSLDAGFHVVLAWLAPFHHRWRPTPFYGRSSCWPDFVQMGTSPSPFSRSSKVGELRPIERGVACPSNDMYSAIHRRLFSNVGRQTIPSKAESTGWLQLISSPPARMALRIDVTKSVRYQRRSRHTASCRTHDNVARSSVYILCPIKNTPKLFW